MGKMWTEEDVKQALEELGMKPINVAGHKWVPVWSLQKIEEPKSNHQTNTSFKGQCEKTVAVKNFAFRENWVDSKVVGMKAPFFAIFDPTWTHILAPKGQSKEFL